MNLVFTDFRQSNTCIDDVWVYCNVFSAIYTKGDNFCDFLFASQNDEIV